MKPTPPDGMRVIYGNYDVDPGRRRIMHSVTGFQQEAAPHIKQSELCATCHTLITQAFGPDGAVIGELHEQMNFQEWQHSDYAKTEQRSCQSCHMPSVAGPIRIASVLGDQRDSLARHTFVGGNAHMLRLLNRFRNELGVTAPAGGDRSDGPGHGPSTAAGHGHDSRQRAAVRMRAASPSTSMITNLTGHKFPTGYPSRRTWLHVTVRDCSRRNRVRIGRDHRCRPDSRQRQRP